MDDETGYSGFGVGGLCYLDAGIIAKKSKSRVIRSLAIQGVVLLIVVTVFGLLRMHRII